MFSTRLISGRIEMKNKRLEQIARSGKIAKAILKNRRDIEKLPDERIALKEMTGKKYDEFGDRTDRDGDYYLINDVRVQEDIVIKYLDSFYSACRYLGRHYASREETKIEDKTLIRRFRLYLNHIRGPLEEYYRDFRQKLTDRKMNSKDYLDPIIYTPAEFLFKLYSDHFKGETPTEYPQRLNDLIVKFVEKGIRQKLEKVAKEHGVKLWEK